MTGAAQPDPRPSWRPATSRRMVAVGVGLALLLVAVRHVRLPGHRLPNGFRFAIW